MALSLRTKDQFVANEISAIQAALPGTFQFSVGSIILAITQAHGSTAVWEESLVQFVLARTRLSTSQGADCDSFVEDFGYSRPVAVAASGDVTFTSNSTTQQRLIPAYPIPATVSTVDSSATFTVQVDTTNPAYSVPLGGYVMGIGIATIDVPVLATVAGIIGNAGVNTITVINSQIVGVDYVTNEDLFDTGKDAASDTQLKADFVLYLQSLARATEGAIDFAVQSVVGVVDYNVVENIDYTTGDPLLGQFWVVADDGTGDLPSNMMASISNNLNSYRGLTIRYAVYAPTIINPTITATVNFPTDYTSEDFPTLVEDIEDALKLYVSLIPFGETLFYTRLGQIIYNVIAAEVPNNLIPQFNVTAILLDASTSDVPSNSKSRFICNSCTITPLPS